MGNILFHIRNGMSIYIFVSSVYVPSMDHLCSSVISLHYWKYARFLSGLHMFPIISKAFKQIITFHWTHNAYQQLHPWLIILSYFVSLSGKPCLSTSSINSVWTHVSSDVSDVSCSCDTGFQRCPAGKSFVSTLFYSFFCPLKGKSSRKICFLLHEQVKGKERFKAGGMEGTGFNLLRLSNDSLLSVLSEVRQVISLQNSASVCLGNMWIVFAEFL